ncbi:MAG: beta strand repeat-containing protein [Spirosomataceae bacterium]
MKKLSILLFFAVNCALGQSITIDPSTGNSGNININSTNGGIVIPRMTSAQRATISNPAQGLLIYQTDGEVGFYVNRSSLPSIPNWSRLTEGENLWSRTIANSNNITPTNIGNVGIGTPIPTDKLTVQTASNNYGISHTDGTHTISTYVGGNAGWLGTKTLAPLYFYTNGGSTQMTLSTAGNLGIGTSTPSSRLAIQTAANRPGFTHTNGTVDLVTFATASSGGIGTATNHPLTLFTNNGTASPAVTVATDGNVGIGTGGPTSRLTVQTPANSQGITHTTGTIGVATYATTSTGGIGTTTNHPLTLFTNNGTASPAVTIATNGNVGIGNSAPSSALTFAAGAAPKISLNGGTDSGIGLSSGGDVNFYSSNSFMFGSGSNSSFNKAVEISSSGLLGVNLGAISPSGRVDMGSTDGNNLVLRNLNSLVSSNNNNMYFKNGNYWTGRISAMGTSTTEANLSFFTGASTSFSGLTERMTILNNGNVGIGTNNPTSRFQVNGNATINGVTAVNGNTTINASMSVNGSTTINANMSVIGNTSMIGDLRISDGTQGVGKVLVSDASGNSSWRSPAFGAVKVTRPAGGFSSYLTNDFRDGSAYPFNNTTEDLDVSGNWNNTTGIYTVPETGVYEILGDANLYSDTENNLPLCYKSFNYQVQIVKNGTVIEKYIGGYKYDCASNTVSYDAAKIISLLSLTAGDQISFNFTTRDYYSNLYDASNPATIYVARPVVFTIKKL